MGHLYRCLAMVQMLDSKYEITFVCREITGDFEYILTKNNYKLIQIKKENEFLDLCDEKKIVVIDGHHFPSELYQRKYGKRFSKSFASMTCTIKIIILMSS
ncbi:MAG: hypothetical protein IPM04_09865 [Saprospiraceae bacterium]|nr:hypothetical protein [Candidatus Brachybacter algidus]MBK8748159.1 hypothetical protein [Candidatus Brachybacter algidus]